VKIVIEKHPDGYLAYPLGIEGVVVGEGDTYAEALADVQSALQSTLKPLVLKPLPGNHRFSKHTLGKQWSEWILFRRMLRSVG